MIDRLTGVSTAAKLILICLSAVQLVFAAGNQAHTLPQEAKGGVSAPHCQCSCSSCDCHETKQGVRKEACACACSDCGVQQNKASCCGTDSDFKADGF